MSKPLNLLLEIVGNLAAIDPGNSVSVGGLLYTFANTIPAAQIYQGIKLLDAKIDNYPALSVVATDADVSVEWAEAPEQPLTMSFAVEGVDLIGSRSALTVAFELLDDIKNAVPISIAQPNAQDLQPDGWTIQEPEPGSDVILVRRAYVATYYESYPE